MKKIILLSLVFASNFCYAQTPAKNGVTLHNDTIVLGGHLDQPTTIVLDNNSLNISGNGSFGLNGVNTAYQFFCGSPSTTYTNTFADTHQITSLTYGTGISQIKNQAGRIDLTSWNLTQSKLYQLTIDYNNSLFHVISNDSNFQGLQYNADFSQNFNAQSLIDKNYADTHLAGFPFTNTPCDGCLPVFNASLHAWTFKVPFP